MIDRVYISDSDDPTCTRRLEVCAIAASDGGFKGEVILRIVTDESTFSRSEYVAAGADPDEFSDSSFDYGASMISVDLEEFADMVELLRKHAY